MRKLLSILPIFCLCLSTSYAKDWLSRFDVSFKESQQFKASKIQIPEKEDYEEPSVDDYNKAVNLNNQAIEEMNNGNNNEAVKLLKQAVETAPASNGFRKNYLIALNKAKKYNTLIKQGLISLSQEPDDSKTAYLIGLVYLNDLKQNELAANYFSYSLDINPNDSNTALALITALENSEKYSSSVFKLLQKYANSLNETYPHYLLGLKYLDRQNYTKAIKSFLTAKKYDKKGFAHHAYVRGAFYSGNLNGLEEITKNTIANYPNDRNINNTKKIYASLKDSKYSLIEHIKLNISGASSLEELNFNIRPISDFHNHQNVDLISTEILSKGKKLNVEPTRKEDKTLVINIPKSMWSTEIVLNIKYNISIKALYKAYFYEDRPNLEELKKDTKFSLDDKRLEELLDYIDNMTIDDTEDFESVQELFAIKASTAIAKGLKYNENTIDQSVSWALSNLDLCDCTEYSRLLSALCLKKGIPARLATGFLIRNDYIGKESPIGHEWCEIYINGKGWTPIDATLQSTMHRAYFRNLLNDQIFFEYPAQHEKTRVGVDYTARDSNVRLSIENAYIVNYLK